MLKNLMSIETGNTPGRVARAVTLLRCVRGAMLALFLAVPFALSSMPAQAEYRVGAGDKLEISVVGVSELQRMVPVQADGTISFPLLGTLDVGGLTLPDVRARIKASLASKVYRQRSSDGREQVIVIGLDEVTITVVEYRPIYVKGAVARPGEFTYRLSMTVREAVALSGGYDILPIKISNPFLETADFRGEYEALWLEFAKEQARVWRLKAELESREVDDQTVIQSIPEDAPVSRAMVTRIVALATDQFKTRQSDYKRQEDFLRKSIQQIDGQIETITQQVREEKKGAEADAKELARAIKLYNKGTLVSNRVVEARRTVLLSSTRKLQTSAQLMQVKQQKQDLTRQLGRFSNERRIAVLQELEGATVRLGEIRTKLQSVGEKLQYSAISKAQLTDGSNRKLPGVAVHRKESGKFQKMAVTEAFELQPGDVVEVTAPR